MSNLPIPAIFPARFAERYHDAQRSGLAASIYSRELAKLSFEDRKTADVADRTNRILLDLFEREAATDAARDFDVIPGRIPSHKFDKIAEWLGSREDGQRTMRWFRNRETGDFYMADGWSKRSARKLNADQRAYVESLPGLAGKLPEVGAARSL